MRTLKKNVALLIALAMLLTAVFPAFATQSAFIAGGRSYDSVADLLEALRSRTITYSQVYEYDSEVGYRNVEELDVAEFEAINVLADEEGKDFNDIIGDIASYTERLQAEISTREAEVQVKTAEELLDELEVIEVSAITDTVDQDEDQQLHFSINDEDEAADYEALEEAGYTWEFLYNKSGAIYGDDGVVDATSIDTGSTGEFKYLVRIYDADEELVTESEEKTVTVLDYSGDPEGFEEYVLYIDTDVVVESGTLTIFDENVSIGSFELIAMDGETTLESGSWGNVDSAKFTYESSDIDVAIINSAGIIDLISAGDVTFTVGHEDYDIELEVEVEVVAEERAASAEHSEASREEIKVIGEASGTFNVTVRDQFGDPMKDATVTADNVENADDEEIMDITISGDTDEEGKNSVDYTADASNTGTGELELKVGNTVVATVDVTVGEGTAAYRVLELNDSEEEPLIDVYAGSEVNQTIALAYNQYTDEDLLVGKEDQITTGTSLTYKVKSADDDIAEVTEVGLDGTITVLAKAVGTVEIEIWEGSIKRDSLEIEVQDTTPDVGQINVKEAAKLYVQAGLSYDLKAELQKIDDLIEVKDGDTKFSLGHKDSNEWDVLDNENEIGKVVVSLVGDIGAMSIANGIVNATDIDADDSVYLRFRLWDADEDNLYDTKLVPVQFVAVADGTESTVDPTSESVTAGVVQAVTFTFLDDGENPIKKQPVTFGGNLGTDVWYSLTNDTAADIKDENEGDITNFADAVTNLDGEIVVYVLGEDANEDGTVTATVNTVTLTSTLDIVAAGVSSFTTVNSGDGGQAHTLTGAGEQVTITVTITDEFGNPVADGVTANFALSGAESGSISAETAETTDGQATVTYTGPDDPNDTEDVITVTVDGANATEGEDVQIITSGVTPTTASWDITGDMDMDIQITALKDPSWNDILEDLIADNGTAFNYTMVDQGPGIINVTVSNAADEANLTAPAAEATVNGDYNLTITRLDDSQVWTIVVTVTGN